MGARVALPRELDLNALGLRTPQGQAIAAAAQKYGFIINDRNGGSGPCGFTVRVRPNPAVPEPALHRYDHGLSADINQIFAHIVEVHMPSGEPLEGRRGLQPTQRE